MALKYGFYDSHDGDREYSSHDFTRIFNNLIMDGVLPKTVSTNQFAATPATSGLGVKIDSGWAWFDNTYTHLTAPQTFVLDAADAVLYRWDAIVIETDSENRENSIKVIKGTPAAEGAFAKPTLAANQHPLCYAKVTPGLTSMVQGNLENRVGFSDCPFIVSAVGSADLTQVFAQWEYDFDTWFDGVVDTLSGDVAGNLLALIQTNQNDITDIKENLLPLKADLEDLTQLQSLIGTGGNNCRIFSGSYIGNGNGGSLDDPTSISNLPFYPIVVFVIDSALDEPMIMVRPLAKTKSGYTYGSPISVTWANNGVSWQHNSTFISGVDMAQVQLNSNGVVYRYVVLGYNQ